MRADCVYTNTAPSGSYRAFGAVHLQWIGELQVDEVARRCGIDPLEIRRRNLLRPGEQIRPGGKPLDADLVGDVEKVAEALGWGGPREEWVGRGLSVGVLAAGAHPVSMSTVRMEADGRVVVLVGTTEVGQGARTVMAQIAAEVLGLPAERVTVQGTDTRFTPYDRSTGASRSTTVAGLAVQRAAQDLRDKLDGMAGGRAEPGEYLALMRRHFGFTGGELIGQGEVHPEGSGLVRGGPGVLGGLRGRGRGRGGSGHRRGARAAHRDLRRRGPGHQPALVERQDEGATLQGIGNGLFEEMLFAGGVLVNDTLLEYRVPTHRGRPRGDALRDRRERRRPRALRGQGLRRGGPRGAPWPPSPPRSRTRACRCASCRSRPSACGAASRRETAQGG